MNNVAKVEFSDAALKYVAQTHPILFGRHYFPKLMRKPSPPFHFNMFDDIFSHDRILLLAPRDHAKSTLCSFIYPIYRICLDRNIRISLVADTHTQAYKFVGAIRHELEHNAALIRDFGEFIGDNWQKTQFAVQRTLNLKDPTVTGFGLRASKLGDRSDLLICDDIINKKNSLTHLQRVQTKEWFFEVLTNFLEESGGQAIVIGTVQNELDLYHELEENPEYYTARYDAIVDEESKRVLWPSKWSYKSLMKRANEIGKISFDRQFRNRVTSDLSSMFPMKLLRAALDENMAYYSLDEPLTKDVTKQYTFYMGVDLARSARVGADYFVLFTIGVDSNGNRRVFHIYRARGVSFKEQFSLIQDVWNYFRHGRIVIESNQYQGILPDTLKSETSLPIMSYNTGPERNSDSVGVPSMRILFENGKYAIPFADSSKELTHALIDELHNMVFDGGKISSLAAHKDLVMAMWLAEIGVSRSPSFNRFSIVDGLLKR